MENRAHALVAGLFVLLLGIAAALAVWWLGYDKGAVNYYVLEARQNVTGLNLQAQVRYRGIRSGRVESIDLDPNDRRLILVRISLDARYPLTAGTTARLNTQGLTGIAYVQLEDDGSRPEPLVGAADDVPRIGLKPTLLDALGAQAGDIATQTNTVMARLAELLNERNMKNLTRSMENMAVISDGLRESVKDLPASVAALQRALSAANVERLSVTLANLERTTGEAAPLVQEMRDTLRTMSGLAARLDTLAGQTGSELTGETLPRANALLDELTVSSRRLVRLMESIERNPQSLVFGRGRGAPGPGEAGFAGQGK
jgi:phospholipid/cholesterol/gamma-HCH transport system substrate-binding protein